MRMSKGFSRAEGGEERERKSDVVVASTLTFPYA